MKLEKSVFSISVLAILILLAASMVYTGFFMEREEPLIEIPDNMYKCGKTLVPFRANISDCNTFPIEPSDQSFKALVMSPFVDRVLILLDPTGTGSLALSASEIFKTLNSLLVPSGVVYTEAVEGQNVSVLSIENSSFAIPIIWLRENQEQNLILINGSTVIIDAKTVYDLDAAACKLALIAINDKFDCSVE
jgi:hypothetical protein